MRSWRRLPKISPTDLIVGLLFEKGASGKPNEPIDRIRLMKALFLLSQEESRLQGTFKFEPYLYGAVSFAVYDYLRSLEGKGIVTTTKEYENERWNRYYLTSVGIKVAQSLKLPQEVVAKIARVKQYVTSKETYQLLREIYAKYPDFATKSVIRVSNA